MINFVCVNSIIVINHVVYCHIESNKLGTSFNTKINNLLISCSFVPFGEKLLNNEKFKSIYSNGVWNWFEINFLQLNNLLKILLGFNGTNFNFFYFVFKFSVKKIFMRILIYIFIQKMHEMQLELYWLMALIFLFNVCFNNANILISKNWNKCEQCNGIINKFIAFCIQKAITFAIIWLEWLFMINKWYCIQSINYIKNSNIIINHL